MVSTVWVQSARSCNIPTVLLFLSSYVHVIKFGRVSLLEMAHSAHLSPGRFYVVFGYTDLESGCEPTESVRSCVNRVGNVGGIHFLSHILGKLSH